MLPRLAWHSVMNRKGSLLLTLLAIMVGVVLVVGMEHVRLQARASFARTVSGVDLIVGARTSQLNLLLYAVFRIGNATNNVSWDNYRQIANDQRVAWSIPLALGDSHRGYRVLGTTGDFFTHFRHGSQRTLEFSSGEPFAGIFDTVLGSEVAARLGYRTGAAITLAHGMAATSFSNHDDAPFTVVGILAPTGTPVDQTVHISLQGMEAIHLGWQGGTRMATPDYSDPALAQLQPAGITAFMLGLDSRAAVFGLQRDINGFTGEPMTAILPGVALAELWQTVGMAEAVLALVSALVMLATLLGLATMLLSSMKERTREIALYRALGVHSSSILFLVELEVLLITSLGIVAGYLLVCLLLALGRDWLLDEYGLLIEAVPLSPDIGLFMLAILGAALLLGFIPALSAYRSSLAGRLKPGS